MKKTSLLFLFLFIVLLNKNSAQAQTIKNSFNIQGKNLNQKDIDFYKKSIEAADFEQFRLQTQTVILTFKNGFTLELISAKDLVVKNISQTIDINKYSNYPAMPNYKYPTFEILPSGW
ncbi:MAG: hypothetical protein ACXVDC_12060 [Bacteroidia bacterium]